MKITVDDMPAGNKAAIEAAAAITVAAFTHIPHWNTLEEGLEELQEALEPGKICLAAWNEDGDMLGWIGGMHSYAMVWELHPLAVHPERQRQGVGRMLVAALEERIVAAGGMTVTLGSDDEWGATNLFGRELYPDVLAMAQRLRDVADHPFVFYQKMGYVVTGLTPDANGFGMPDIHMCKRVGVV